MNQRYVWAAIAAAVVVIGVLVGFSIAGGDGDGGSERAAIEGVASVEDLLRGVPQAGNVLGEVEAPVQIVEYGDLACPACKLASETTIPDLVDQFVRSGEAKLEFRPIAFISASSERGALGAEAAAEQDAMWSLVELLYLNQGDEGDDWLTDELLEQAVTALGLDLAQFRQDYASDAAEARFGERQSAAEADDVRSTPTFVVRGPLGTRSIRGAVEASEIGQAIAEVNPDT